MKKDKNNQKREVWGKKYTNLPDLALTEIPQESYELFIEQGIREVICEINPIEDYTGKNYVLEFGKMYLGEPKYTPSECLKKGVTYDMPIKIDAKLTNKQTGEVIEQKVFLGNMPKMTQVGTFIVNGIERCVVNQLIRSPGAFFTRTVDVSTGRIISKAEIRPARGAWLEFEIARNDTVTVKIDRRRKFPATTLLRAMGMGNTEEILARLGHLDKEFEKDTINLTLNKDVAESHEEAVLEIYRKLRVGEPAILDNAKEFINNLFFNVRRYFLGRVGRFKLNSKLGLDLENVEENWVLTVDDVVATIEYLCRLSHGEGEVDDIDHLGNRRIRSVGELVALGPFRLGFLRLERAIKEKMSMASADFEITPSMLVNARPIIAVVNEFFRTSQLSSILDQTNPLAEVDNLRRVTVMGVGGVTRERASFSIRDINASQYGRICPIRSPEGPNIGLVTYLAMYSRINPYGFLEVPYKKVVEEKKNGEKRMKITDEIVYLTAEKEADYYITHAGVEVVGEDGYLNEGRVPVRYKGDFLEVDSEKIQLVDITPMQVVGIAASLIPFIAHDEANRSLMGTHMQCQAVPLLKPSAPIIGTGMEEVAASAMGRVVKARDKGRVIYVDGSKVTVKYDKKLTKEEVKKANKNWGIEVKEDEETYHVEKFKKTSNSTSFSQKPIVSVGDKVEKGEVIIDGPATDNGELALGKNLLIAYMAYEGFGYEDGIVVSDRLVKDDSLTSVHVEEYEAVVVETKLGPEETTSDIPNVGDEDLRNLDKDGVVVVGSEVAPNDILVGKIAPKGETELTAEERLLRAIFGEKAREVRDTSLRMPHGEKGIVIDISILDKEKGDELEPGTLKVIKVKVAQERKLVVGDKLSGRHGNKGVISQIVPTYDMPYLADGRPVDVIISPISVLSRMNLGQLLETHLGWAAEKLGRKIGVPVFEKISEEQLIDLLKEAGLPTDGKTDVYDGKTGEKLDRKVVVGIEYIMKLIHMVEDKTHARSTGPYSLVTQQPLGGKAQMGGQRLGEMEVWTLESHRAAYTLQEMLTIKSDDVVGRAKAFEAIVKGTDIPSANIPESFKVLVKELNSLGLSVSPEGVKSKEVVEIEEDIEDVVEVEAKEDKKEESVEKKEVKKKKDKKEDEKEGE